jgi:hypothetical protein
MTDSDHSTKLPENINQVSDIVLAKADLLEVRKGRLRMQVRAPQLRANVCVSPCGRCQSHCFQCMSVCFSPHNMNKKHA